MRLLRIIFITSILIPVFLFSAPPIRDIFWDTLYGGEYEDMGVVGIQTSDHQYLIVGNTASYGAGNSDIYLIKTDTANIVLWDSTFGSTASERVLSAALLFDRGFLMCGTSFENDSINLYYLRTDSVGNTIKDVRVGASGVDFGTDVIMNYWDSCGILLGHTTSYGAGEQDIYLVKFDTAGDTLWTQTYGSSNYDYGWDITSTYDSGFVIVGEQYFNGASDIYVIKTDSVGDTVWTKTFGDTIANDYAYSVCETLDSCYVMTGKYDTSIFLYKLNAAGNVLFSSYFAAPYGGVGRSVIQGLDSTYMIAGYTNWTTDSSNLLYIINADLNGDTVFTRTYGNTYTNYGFDISQSTDINDSTFIITGSMYNILSKSWDIYFLKFHK